MSKKPSASASKASGGEQGGGEAARIDVGDLTEVVTRSVTRALGVRDAAKLPIRIICGIVCEPPDFFRGGGGQQQ